MVFKGLHWEIDDSPPGDLIIRDLTDGVQTSFIFKADGRLLVIESTTKETTTVFKGTLPELADRLETIISEETTQKNTPPKRG